MMNSGFKDLIYPDKWTKNINYISKIKFIFLVALVVFFCEELLVLVRYLLDMFGFSFRIKNSMYSNSGGNNVFILILLYIPFYEEVAFRMPLRFSSSKFIISLSLIGGLIVKIFATRFWVFEINSVWMYLVCDFFLILITFIFISIVYKHVRDSVERFVCNNYNLYFFIMNIVWVLFHLNNFDVSINDLPIIFFTLINFFILGFLFSALRLKNGLVWSMIFHSLYNLYVFASW